MKHIGQLIREERNKRKMSAEFVAGKLKKPISKQAFAKKERVGSFSFELVKEVAEIIGCDMNIFLPSKTTKRLQRGSTTPHPAA